MSNQIHFNKRTIAYLALNAFGLFIVYLLSDFITSFLGALIFFVLFRRMMNYMVDKRGWRPSTSAILIILISFIIVLVPVITFSNLLYSKIIQIVSNPDTIIGPIKLLDAKMVELTGRQLFSPELISTMQEKLGQIIPSFISKLFVLLGNIGMMYFILYYMLVQRINMQKEVNNYLPFNHANIKLLSGELESQTLSNSIGVPLIATIQGTAAGIGYWIFGMKQEQELLSKYVEVL